jgi:Protein of unknown function (DUF3047)
MNRHSTRYRIAVILHSAAILLLTCSHFASAQDVIDAGKFSSQKPGGTPPDWKPLTFRNIEKHTGYSLVTDNGVTVLKADSNASASGLTRDLTSLKLDIREYPILKWRWKVANLIKNADIATKEGDDYPARVYVTFRYDPERASVGMRMQYGMAKSLYGEYPPHAGINCVWDGKATVGTMVPNAYTARAMMFVVESGAKRVGDWVEVERNVYDDYKRAFKEEPPPVLGIAVMTDTDSTGEAAVAWYGDITLRKKSP